MTDPAAAQARPVVVAVVGSPRGRSNTAALVAAALEELEAAGASCETISLRDVTIAPCLAHDACADYAACPLADDAAAVLERVYAADCLVLGTPVYYENVSAQMKALIDRSLFRYSHDRWLCAAVVGLVAVTAETGLQDALEALRRFVDLSSEGEIPTYTCGGYAGDAGEAAGDVTLLAEARAMGRALAEELGLTPV
jgi:multimeric flavodoxin WrbA